MSEQVCITYVTTAEAIWHVRYLALPGSFGRHTIVLRQQHLMFAFSKYVKSVIAQSMFFMCPIASLHASDANRVMLKGPAQHTPQAGHNTAFPWCFLLQPSMVLAAAKAVCYCEELQKFMDGILVFSGSQTSPPHHCCCTLQKLGHFKESKPALGAHFPTIAHYKH